MTCNQIEQQLRAQVAKLTLDQLKRFAVAMGVDVLDEETREDIVNNCVAAEQYAFTH